MRNQGNAREYLQQMIDEGHEHFDHELDGTHVTNVAGYARGFWNKLVDEGMLDGAHEHSSIRTNHRGDEHHIYAYDRETKQPWGHELSEDYADYHNLPKEGYLDNFL